MSSDRPIFCSVDLAARIERVESQMIAEATAAAARRDPGLGAFVRPLAGGVACFAGGDSPLTKIAGLGFAGAPTADELDAIEADLAARGVSPRVELSTLADPALAALFTRRGHVMIAVENVLGIRLPAPERPPLPEGVMVEHHCPGDPGSWLDLMITGFAHPDVGGAAVEESFPREVLEAAMRDLAGAAGFTRLIARRDGAPAGAASLRIDGGIALFCGAATVPAHRRRGIQSALLGERLVAAADAGCDLAIVVTQPGTRSQENAQRQGFHLLYSRAILVREEPATIARA